MGCISEMGGYTLQTELGLRHGATVCFGMSVLDLQQ
jgi:hypothetical protein